MVASPAGVAAEAAVAAAKALESAGLKFLA